MAFSYNFFLLTLLLLPLSYCDNYNYLQHSCTNTIDNIEINALIADTLFYLTDKTPDKGFISSSLSSSRNDTILHGLAQCRGDANADLCSKCIKDAGIMLIAKCSSQTQAYIWYDSCFLRYDIVNFLGNWTIGGAKIFKHSSVESKNHSAFAPAVNQMVDNLKTMVNAPGANLFATTVESNITNLEGVNIYGMAYCTGDLNESTCNECLNYVQSLLPNSCKNSIGCNFLHSSCFLRYETYAFFTLESH